ncbi:MAG: glycosyl transferase [Spirochaetota bacterium]
MKIAYYVSGHGFGHISRSYEICKLLLQKQNVDKLYLVSSRSYFVNEKHSKLIFRNTTTDVGMVQKTSISLDIPASERACKDFLKQKKQLLASELAFLKESRIDCIVSDSSSLPFLLAQQLAVPSFYIGNFTWDFIYSHYQKQYPFFQEYAKELEEEYSLAAMGFILPFHCPITAIKNKRYTGLVGRKATRDKKDVRKQLGFAEDISYFLYSFGAYGIEENKVDLSALPQNHKIVVAGYKGLQRPEVLHIEGIDYPDVVKACDYVVTKPGYGILSECYFAGTPILYTDRGDFPEYPYLLQALKDSFISKYISQEQVYRFDFAQTLEQLVPPQKTTRYQDGATEIAEAILAAV